uniref:FRIGIDA-like protein n=1 Tax=Opuntia streptacantha TaxID=393608 RepID=A0A7C9AWA1_OPUST
MAEVQSFFDKLGAQKTVLSTCLDVYKTLTSHFTSLEQAITSRIQTLDSKLQTLDSDFDKTLESLQRREASIPDRLASLSSLVESQKQAAIDEFKKPPPNDDVPFSQALISLCRKMDAYGVLKLVVARRKESTAFRSEILSAIEEAVDPPRLVLDVVREFVEQKAAGKSWMTDKRWVCGVLVGGMFKPDDLKKGTLGVGFSRAIAERAENLLRDWRDKAVKAVANDSGEGLSGMAPAEASMFLQIVLGFGLKDKFEDEFYKKLVMEFASRRDMAKLAVPLFGEKVEDIIDELVKKGKEVEAVYFASESGLTERFQPVSLLKSYLQRTEKKGNHNSSATDEASNREIDSIKSLIKCIEDHKLEAELPLESLRKRLTSLEKAKADRKKASAAGSKPPNKRGPVSGGAWGSGPPLHPAAKIPRYSSPYPLFAERNPLSPIEQSPVSRYPGPYSYPSQGTFDTGLSASSYGSTYGSSYASASAQTTPRHYSAIGDSLSGAGARVGASYGGNVGSYGSYDYGSASTHTYQPSSYIQ